MLSIRFALEGILSNTYGYRLAQSVDNFGATPFLVSVCASTICAEYLS